MWWFVAKTVWASETLEPARVGDVTSPIPAPDTQPILGYAPAPAYGRAVWVGLVFIAASSAAKLAGPTLSGVPSWDRFITRVLTAGGMQELLQWNLAIELVKIPALGALIWFALVMSRREPARPTSGVRWLAVGMTALALVLLATDLWVILQMKPLTRLHQVGVLTGAISFAAQPVVLAWMLLWPEIRTRSGEAIPLTPPVRPST